MSRRRVRLATIALAALAALGALGAAAAGAARVGDDAPAAEPGRAGSDASSSTTRPSTTTDAPTSTTSTPPTTAPLDVHALRPPAAAGDPAGLAAQILYAETVLRDPTSGPGPFAEAALAQQVAYRQLGLHPEWDAAVTAALPAELHETVARHVLARREFRSMHRRLSTTLPAWRIVPPEPVDQLKATYLEAEAAFGVPWQYLAAIHLVETGTGRIRGTSSAGAQGPMQFMPATWAAYGGGGDVNDTRDAILGAARYLAANGGGADIRNALWNYNHSDRYVQGVQVYADLMLEHPRALEGFHHWGVWYLTAAGDVYLPVGYDEPAPKPVGTSTVE